VDDTFEQEAEVTADKVMRMPEQNFVQRKCDDCADIQRTPLATTPAAASSALPQPVVAQWQAAVTAGNYLGAVNIVAQEMIRRGEIDTTLFRVQQATAGAAICRDPAQVTLFIIDPGVNGANTQECPCVTAGGNRLANPRIRIHPDMVHLMGLGASSGAQSNAEMLHSTLLHEFRHVRQQHENCHTPGVVTSNGICTDCNNPEETDAYLAEIEAGYNSNAIMNAWTRVFVNWNFLSPAQQAIFQSRRTAAEQKVNLLFPGTTWNTNHRVQTYLAWCQSLGGGGAAGQCNSFLTAPGAGAAGSGSRPPGPAGSGSGSPGPTGSSGGPTNSPGPFNFAPAPDHPIDWLSMRQPYLNRGADPRYPGDRDAITQQWNQTNTTMRGLGFNESRAAWISNHATPVAVDSALQHDYPTRWETMDREMGTSSTVVSGTVVRFKKEDSAPADNASFIQRKCGQCEEEEHPAAGSVSDKIQAAKGSGNQLEEPVRSFMGNRFGADFHNVNIHTDGQAVQLSRDLNAKAFTVGNDIYFNEGQYRPDSASGQHLLAHELTHTLQQNGPVRTKIMRAVSDADVEADFQKWAAGTKRTINKGSDDYPQDLWTFAASLIQNSSGTGPKAKPAAGNKTALDEWNTNFEKAGIVAKWLFDLKNTTKSDQIKYVADQRAAGILDYMAQSGLVSKAMAQQGNLDDKNKKNLFETILKAPAATSPAELETILNFQVNGQKDPNQVDFINTLCKKDGNALQKLDVAHTQALFRVMAANYPKDDKIVEAMAQVLIFNPAVRTTLAADMTAGRIGSPELLFTVLSHPYFKDPDYPGAQLLNNPNNDIDKDTAKHWKDDMPFAIKTKQQLYVKFLTDLGVKNGITMKAPANFTIAALRTWLDTNTENIGQIAAKEYPKDNDAIFNIYKNIADIFFYHIEKKDAIADPEGKLAKLGLAGKPDKTRIEADCDVFATYAMRLYNSAGFEPIGYLGMYPNGTFANRAAHAAALIRKNNEYFIINNKNMFKSGISDTKANDKKEAAIVEMQKQAIQDAYADPLPTTLDVYYADALAKGVLPADFLNKPAKYKRP